MKKFAVGYMSFFDNVLKIEIVEAENFKSSIVKHSLLRDSSWLSEIPDDLEEIKTFFWNTDSMIDVLEIT